MSGRKGEVSDREKKAKNVGRKGGRKETPGPTGLETDAPAYPASKRGQAQAKGGKKRCSWEGAGRRGAYREAWRIWKKEIST